MTDVKVIKSIRLTPELAEKIAQLAKKQGISQNAVIILLLQRGLMVGEGKNGM